MKQILLLILIAFTNLAISQTVLLTPFEAPEKDKSTEHLKDFSLLQVDVKSIQSILENTKGHIYKLNLRMPDRVYQLELYEYSLLRDENIRNAGGTGRIKRLPKRTDFRTFQGIVNGQNNSMVSLTIADGFLRIMINDRKDKVFLEPYSGADKSATTNAIKQKFVFYSEKNVLPNPNVVCSATEVKREVENAKQLVESRSAPCLACHEVQIAIAADNSMVEKYGSVMAVDNFINANLADVQTVFDDEFGYELMYILTGVFIADDKLTDPFVNDRNVNSQLATFRGQAPSLFSGSEYDVATCWSSKFVSPNVEAADQAGVCNANKYCVVTSFIPGVLMHPAYLTIHAHGLGHVWSATHDAASSNTIMNPFLSQSDVWSSQSQRDIFSYIFFNNLIQPGGCLPVCQGTGTPIPEFSADITYGCQPLTVKFKDASSFTTGWKWRFPGGTPDSSVLQNPTVIYRTAGLYPVTLEASNGRCSTVLIKYDFINVNDDPIAAFSYGVQGREIFFIDQSPRATEWHWLFGDGEESFDQFPAHEYPKDTTWEVTLIVKNDCGEDTIKKKILVESIPVAEFDSDLKFGCAPQTIKFLDMSTNNVKTWQWEFVGGTPSVSTAKNPVIRYDLPGTYDVKLTVYATKFHSSLTKTMYITIDSIPIANFTNTVNVGRVDFKNNSRHAKSHLWLFGDNTSSTDSNPSHDYNEGIYKVQYVAINACGSDTAETTLTIGVKPTAQFQSNTVKGCVPYQVQFQNMSVAATSYRWYFPGGTPSTSTDPNPLVTYNTAGKYNVSLVAANVFYSDSIGKADYVDARTKPSSTFTHTISGFKSTFVNNSTGGTNYLWDFGDKKVSFEKDPVHDYGVEGEFTVRLISQNECGLDTFIKQIAVFLVPKVDFKVDTVVGCVPYKVQFFDKSSVDVIEWDWQFENGIPATSKEKNPIVIFDKIGKYAVKLDVKNTNGSNSRTKTQYIQVVSSVLCPEHTKTSAFSLSEGEFGFNLEHRADNTNVVYPIIFPNPAQDYIYVKANASGKHPVQIEVFDLAGRKRSEHISKESEFRIQTDKLSSGTYYIKMNDGYKTSINKFIISN